MRLLVISNRFPYPVRDGADLRKYFLMKALAERHDLTLLCQPYEAPKSEDIAHMETFLAEIKLFVREPETQSEAPRLLGQKLTELFIDPSQYFVFDQLYDDVQQEIKHRAASGHYHGLLAFGFGLRTYVEEIQDVPVIVDVCDDPSVFYRRLIRHRRDYRTKLNALKDWLLMRRFEKRELGKLREVLLVSSKDAKVFRARCPRVNVTVVSNGVNAHYYRRHSKERPTEPKLIFTGVMDYEPNITGAVYFCTKIFPLVKSQIPAATIQIVGRSPSERVKALSRLSEGIEVTGAVDDIRPYIERAMIYVCPLRSGAGIKNKILEAWSMEMPIVATSISCEGIDVSPGEDILIGDRPPQFAGCVIRLIRDADRCERMGVRGREKILEKYSWDARAVMVEQIYQRLLEKTSDAVVDRD